MRGAFLQAGQYWAIKNEDLHDLETCIKDLCYAIYFRVKDRIYGHNMYSKLNI